MQLHFKICCLPVDLLSALNADGNVFVIFLDLSKAFKYVGHFILHKKINQFKIRNNVFTWM